VLSTSFLLVVLAIPDVTRAERTNGTKNIVALTGPILCDDLRCRSEDGEVVYVCSTCKICVESRSCTQASLC
jgi:hypothetical protein